MKKEELEHLSHLSRIALSPEETKGFLEDFEHILEYVAQVENVSFDGDATPEVGAHHSVFREDRNPHEGGIYTDDLLKSAANIEEKSIVVKKILNND